MNTEQALPVPIRYVVDDEGLPVGAFLDLVQRVWPGSYVPALAQQALRRTVNITAWHGEQLVGCVRLLTDGYFFGTIPEILVDPAWRGQGIDRRLMDLAWEASPTSLFLGAQPGNEGFFSSGSAMRAVCPRMHGANHAAQPRSGVNRTEEKRRESDG